MLDLLKTAKKTVRMTTQYDIVDGPLVPMLVGNGRVRLERITIRSWDTGYVEVTAEGRSVTKDGRRKGSYMQSADFATVDAVKVALEGL